MNVGILTSVETRHRHFVHALRRALNVVAVAYEQPGYQSAQVDASDLTPSDRRIVAAHFEERARQERRFFGSNSDGALNSDAVSDSAGATAGDSAVRHLAPGTLNDDATVGFLLDADVDTVVVYGTNLVRPPLLGRWPGRMINMHLGLSPYYRGTATNFYPLLNEEPEYVGATIHLLDAGIDSGAICRHARPRIVADDTPHTIGCKAIRAGIEAMLAVLADLARGGVTPVAQWQAPHPRLYLRKDYHPRHVVELHHKVEAGLIPRYVERATRETDRIRLVE